MKQPERYVVNIPIWCIQAKLIRKNWHKVGPLDFTFKISEQRTIIRNVAAADKHPVAMTAGKL